MKKQWWGAVAVIAAAACLVTGCGAKPKAAVTSDQFTAVAQGLSFRTTDLTDQYTDETYVVAVIRAANDSSEVDFFEVLSDDFATAVYDTNLDNVQGLKLPGAEETTVTQDGYQKYTLKNSGEYWVVIQLGGTVLFGWAPLNKTGALEELIKQIGY